jgi:hypothetical protein
MSDDTHDWGDTEATLTRIRNLIAEIRDRLEKDPSADVTGLVTEGRGLVAELDSMLDGVAAFAEAVQIVEAAAIELNPLQPETEGSRDQMAAIVRAVYPLIEPSLAGLPPDDREVRKWGLLRRYSAGEEPSADDWTWLGEQQRDESP